MAEVTNSVPPAMATPPIQPPAQLPWTQRYKWPLRLLVVLILAAIVAVAAWQATGNKINEPWGNLVAATACPAGKGQAMSFLKPSVFDYKASDSSANEAVFSQVQYSNGTNFSTGFLDAACVTTQSAAGIGVTGLLPSPTAAKVAAFGQALKDPTKAQYAVDTLAFTSFISQRIPTSDYELLSNQATSFTSPNIRSQAWRIDFIYSRNSKAPAYLPAQKKGTLLLIAGSNTWYYLMLSGTDQNWQANPQSISKLLNSVKVDQ